MIPKYLPGGKDPRDEWRAIHIFMLDIFSYNFLCPCHVYDKTLRGPVITT